MTTYRSHVAMSRVESPETQPVGAVSGLSPVAAFTFTDTLCPDWWAPGAGQPERKAARHVCHTCPLLLACREWSLSLPTTDTTIYGGLTTNERLRAKRERAATAVA
jgi:hypothetical protein